MLQVLCWGSMDCMCSFILVKSFLTCLLYSWGSTWSVTLIICFYNFVDTFDMGYSIPFYMNFTYFYVHKSSIFIFNIFSLFPFIILTFYVIYFIFKGCIRVITRSLLLSLSSFRIGYTFSVFYDFYLLVSGSQDTLL